MSKVNNKIKALNNFRQAYLNLLKEFSNDNIINETNAIGLYPFNTDFGEIDVVRWVDETVDELNSK